MQGEQSVTAAAVGGLFHVKHRVCRASADQENHLKVTRPGDHFLSERPEKCAPMAGGQRVNSRGAEGTLKLANHGFAAHPLKTRKACQPRFGFAPCLEDILSLPTTVGSADAHRRKRQRSRGPTHHVRQAEVI